MKHKLVEIGGKQYKFRITNRSQAEIEKKIGPLLKGLERLAEAQVMTTIVWGALNNPLNHGITLDACYDLVDQMIDEGIIDTAEKRSEFLMELMVDAGFFSQEHVKVMKGKTEEEMKKLQSNQA